MNYQIVFFCGSDLHGPSATHCAGSGRTLARALARARDNPPRMLKYWRAAMRAAGYRVI